MTSDGTVAAFIACVVFQFFHYLSKSWLCVNMANFSSEATKLMQEACEELAKTTRRLTTRREAEVCVIIGDLVGF